MVISRKEAFSSLFVNKFRTRPRWKVTEDPPQIIHSKRKRQIWWQGDMKKEKAAMNNENILYHWIQTSLPLLKSNKRVKKISFSFCDKTKNVISPRHSTAWTNKCKIYSDSEAFWMTKCLVTFLFFTFLLGVILYQTQEYRGCTICRKHISLFNNIKLYFI